MRSRISAISHSGLALIHPGPEPGHSALQFGSGNFHALEKVEDSAIIGTEICKKAEDAAGGER
jgi:hypothetical protein